jgi:mycothiol synthase
VTITVGPFDPNAAQDSDLTDYHAMRAAAVARDMPEDPPLTYASAIGRLRTPPVADGACAFWAARFDGRLIGSAKVSLPTGDNAGIARAEVVVHPEQRRRGIGTMLLRAALPAILDSARPVVLGVAMKPDSAGARWTARLGFEVTHRTVMQVLLLESVPPQLWDVPVPPGYRLARWINTTPDDLIDSYAAARPAIQDAPQGRTSYRETTWTPALIRETEREQVERDVEERVVVAIDTATGQVAGVTGILNYPHRREYCYVNETSVSAPHRGHGLGRAMKAAMTRWLREERPDIERILTTTAADNKYMINVNHALGYQTARTMIWVETPTTRLADTLAAIPTRHRCFASPADREPDRHDA